MKTKFVIIVLLLLFQNIFSQNITGSWYGKLDVQRQTLPLVVHIEKVGNDLKSSFDSPLQGAKGIPIKNTLFENNELKAIFMLNVLHHIPNNEAFFAVFTSTIFIPVNLMASSTLGVVKIAIFFKCPYLKVRIFKLLLQLSININDL